MLLKTQRMYDLRQFLSIKIVDPAVSKSFLKDLYIRSLASLTTGTGIESITMAWL